MALIWNPQKWGVGTGNEGKAGDKRLRLTDDDVRELRRLRREKHWRYCKLAKHFGISPRQASNVAQYKSRAGVED